MRQLALMHRVWTVIVLLVVGCYRTTDQEWPGSQISSSEHAIAHYRLLDGYQSRNEYLLALRRQGDIAALTAIAQANEQFSFIAAAYGCELVASHEAVRHCQQFPVGEPTWHSAVHMLSCHQKEHVIDYLKAISIDVANRARCYKVCQNAGWDDLYHLAANDLFSSHFVFEANQSEDEMFLGQIALSYVRSVEKSRRKSPGEEEDAARFRTGKEKGKGSEKR